MSLECPPDAGALRGGHGAQQALGAAELLQKRLDAAGGGGPVTLVLLPDGA